VILVDTGPLVALFDLQDEHHERCVKTLKSIRAPIGTTVAVLTEAFHMLEPQSMGSDRLREFIAKNAMSVWFFEQASLLRAFELMELYADRPMDLADASLVAAAEALDTRTIFTIDRDDFATYRVRRGHRHFALEVLPAG
jgi:predicted nucleic acid-binding protein